MHEAPPNGGADFNRRGRVSRDRLRWPEHPLHRSPKPRVRSQPERVQGDGGAKRGDHIVPFSAAVGWALYLGGLDELPAWDRFGKGLVAGSTAGLVVHVITRFIQRARAKPSPDRAPAPQSR